MSPELALELAARRLEGHTLARVAYLDPWDAPSHPDRAGLAVYLSTASSIFEVRWADELGLRHGFGIAIREVTVIDSDRGRLTDVHWDVIGQRITRAHIDWQPIEPALRSSIRISVALHTDHLGRIDYPCALELAFPTRVISIRTDFTSSLLIALT